MQNAINTEILSSTDGNVLEQVVLRSHAIMVINNLEIISSSKMNKIEEEINKKCLDIQESINRLDHPNKNLVKDNLVIKLKSLSDSLNEKLFKIDELVELYKFFVILKAIQLAVQVLTQYLTSDLISKCENSLAETKNLLRKIYKLIWPDYKNNITHKLICEIIGEEYKMKYILFGFMGQGKSTTGNKLLTGLPYYELIVGDGRKPATDTIYFRNEKSLLIIDTPGFNEDEFVFHRELARYKSRLINESYISAIILFAKFEGEFCEGFEQSAKEFLKIFGTEAVKSLLVLCIQGGEVKFDKIRFEKIIRNSSGYQYLKSQVSSLDIQFCMWDNFNEYPGQLESFDNCIDRLERFKSSQIQSLFDLSNHVKEIKMERMKSNQIRNELEKSLAYKNKLLRILIIFFIILMIILILIIRK